MSRTGMIAATEHGAQLPQFSSLGEAESALFAERDQLLSELAGFARESGDFKCTFDEQSLRALEVWYFRLREGDGFEMPSMPQVKFERCIAVYFGETLVRTSKPFEWFVSEYAFSPGRYELGVRRGLVSIMLSGPMSPVPVERNKRMQSLWRQYRRYAG